MSGIIAGGLSQAAANTAYLAKGDEIFQRPPVGPWALFSDVVPCEGQFLELDTIGPSPIVRELVGSRRFGALRAYAKRQRVTPYSTDALELSRLQVEKDVNGSVTRRLNDYLSSSANFWDKATTDALLANPTGIDGVALISASHPFGFGGNWSNNAAAALSPSTFASGIAAMSALQLENGEPAGFYPTHLMVGPKNEKMARDLCTNPLRPFPIAATGLEAYASAVAATAIQNGWFQGSIEVVVNKRMVGATNELGWLLMDLSRPGVRPMIVGEAMAPRAVVVDDPGSEPMLQRSNYAYYVEGYAAISGYAPHGIYGTMTGS